MNLDDRTDRIQYRLLGQNLDPDPEVVLQERRCPQMIVTKEVIGNEPVILGDRMIGIIWSAVMVVIKDGDDLELILKEEKLKVVEEWCGIFFFSFSLTISEVRSLFLPFILICNRMHFTYFNFFFSFSSVDEILLLSAYCFLCVTYNLDWEIRPSQESVETFSCQASSSKRI